MFLCFECKFSLRLLRFLTSLRKKRGSSESLFVIDKIFYLTYGQRPRRVISESLFINYYRFIYNDMTRRFAESFDLFRREINLSFVYFQN